MNRGFTVFLVIFTVVVVVLWSVWQVFATFQGDEGDATYSMSVVPISTEFNKEVVESVKAKENLVLTKKVEIEPR